MEVKSNESVWESDGGVCGYWRCVVLQVDGEVWKIWKVVDKLCEEG